MEKKIKFVDFSQQKFMAFKFMYIGKNYDGLVIQNHTKNTVEEHIINALKNSKLIDSQSDNIFDTCNFARCGRTDAGVSSTGNVFSVKLRYKDGCDYDYIKIINSQLPRDIMIIGSTEVSESFDARFSCLYREYKYFFLRQNMDMEKIKIAVSKLEGVHNFFNFCKIDKSNENFLTKNYERRIYEFSIEKCAINDIFFPRNVNNQNCNDCNPYFDMYVATIKGSAFLWHQVRCMMGIVFLIGKGLEDIEIIDKMLDITDKNIYHYEIANDLPLILSDCQFEGVKFTNTTENNAESFFSLSRIYQENIISTAMNSFFIRKVTGLLSKEEEEVETVNYLETKYRRKKKYTKLLNHKHNRTKK